VSLRPSCSLERARRGTRPTRAGLPLSRPPSPPPRLLYYGAGEVSILPGDLLGSRTVDPLEKTCAHPRCSLPAVLPASAPAALQRCPLNCAPSGVRSRQRPVRGAGRRAVHGKAMVFDLRTGATRWPAVGRAAQRPLLFHPVRCKRSPARPRPSPSAMLLTLLSPILPLLACSSQDGVRAVLATPQRTTSSRSPRARPAHDPSCTAKLGLSTRWPIITTLPLRYLKTLRGALYDPRRDTARRPAV